jgi:hypothetical protein
MAAVGYLRSSHAASGSGPASWRVSDRTLSIADGAGTTLWSHQFPIELTGLKRDDANFPAGARRVLMTDLDGDGRNEVLASVRSDEHRDESALYVFNADGSLRFRYAPSASRVFGDETFAGPWFPYRLFVLSDARGRPSIWAAFIHGMWYPSVLVELSGEGQVLGEYWSAGYIERVVATHWRGQPVVLVGGTNNESRGASLAVFPRTGIAGVSPAENPRYRCQSCPAGGPMEFLVFPRRCVSIRAEVQATVLDLWRDDLDRLHVLVVDGAVHTGSTAATAWYVLGADLAVTASYTPSFETFHRELERTGLLDHVFGPRDTAGLFPVLRWVNQHFEALASPARTN